MAAVLPAKVTVTYRYWYAYSVHLDQTGDTCVANAWTHFLTDSPRTHRLWSLDRAEPVWSSGWTQDYKSVQSGEQGFRGWLYDKAQAVDEWADTPPEGGTSVRAGAKALASLGAIKSYHWAAGIDDVVTAVLTEGPVVMGTTWWNSMFWPDSKGQLVVDPESGVAGGHAWVIDGVNTVSKQFRMKNSWGTAWGDKGFATLAYTDFNRLWNDGAEACIALEP